MSDSADKKFTPQPVDELITYNIRLICSMRPFIRPYWTHKYFTIDIFY